MATNTFKAGYTVKYGSTPVAIEEVTGVSGLGAVAELVEATHFGSGGSREYISGLLDGTEFTVECNQVLTASSVQETVRGDSGTTDDIQIEITDGTNTLTLDFSVVNLGYEYQPSVDDVNKVVFTFKISGAITES